MLSYLVPVLEKYGFPGLVCLGLFALLWLITKSLLGWVLRRDEQATALHMKSMEVASQVATAIERQTNALPGHVQEIKSHITARTRPLYPGEE